MQPKPSAKPNETRISRFLHVVESIGLGVLLLGGLVSWIMPL